MEKKWWQSSVIYQIYPKSFLDSNGDGIGDIQGIINKIDYLKKLGIDVIWLSPVYKSPQCDNGYDISDYMQIYEPFGSMEDMKELIKKCKNNDIKIIMDLVVNHTSDEHKWFIEASKDKNSPYRDYYIWRKGDGTNPPNDLLSNFGGSAWEYMSETGEYYLHFYSKKQPDLNWENAKMRDEICNMMNKWLELGIDGFRMDVIDLIGKVPDKKIKENGPMLHTYLRELNEKTFGKYDCLTVGECWGATPEIGQLYSDPKRKELSMIFQFEQINLDKQAGGQRWDLKELDLCDLKKVFSKWQYELEDKGWNSLFWNNHDLPRIVSRWGNDKEYRVYSAKMLATMLHGMQGTPYIYQGEELGMTNIKLDINDYRDLETLNMYDERKQKGYKHDDIMTSIYARGRDNARTPMQWDNSENAGFTSGTPWLSVNPNYKTINAEMALNDENSIFYYYQKLISLRKEYKIFVDGDFTLLEPEHDKLFIYSRKLDNNEMLVICNFGDDETKYKLPDEWINAEILIQNYHDTKNGILRPWESMILFK